MIYCCFSGTGKTAADEWSLCIDLERHFYKDADLVEMVLIAERLVSLGKTVALGSNADLRMLLQAMDVPYTLVLPDIRDKEVYRNRYRDRKYSKEHITSKCDEGNWERLLGERVGNEKVVILPHCGYFNRLLQGEYNAN
jgi:hypothetical protein